MSELSRREFAEAFLVAAMAPVLDRVAPVPASSPPAGVVSRDPAPLAQALADAIRTQYGERLTEADLAVVTRQIESVLERAEQIRRVPLANGDEPDFVFTAVRSPGDG